jgi:multisubunit Na+/H+ antiporter MnhF subunit
VIWSALYFVTWIIGIIIAAKTGNSSWLDIFPFFGIVTFILSVLLPRERDVRIFTFANSFVYFVYNTINLNIAALSQLFTMISVAVAMFRYREKKHKAEE